MHWLYIMENYLSCRIIIKRSFCQIWLTVLECSLLNYPKSILLGICIHALVVLAVAGDILCDIKQMGAPWLECSVGLLTDSCPCFCSDLSRFVQNNYIFCMFIINSLAGVHCIMLSCRFSPKWCFYCLWYHTGHKGRRECTMASWQLQIYICWWLISFFSWNMHFSSSAPA